MTEREALKLALDAFGEIAWSNETQWQRDRAKEAITAIKEALVQQEQEPVAWRYRMPVEDGHWVWNYATYIDDPKDQQCEPLYTTPPQRKPLTDEEIVLIVADCASSHQHTDIHFARAIEAAHGIKD